jgi:hypothetical protein
MVTFKKLLISFVTLALVAASAASDYKLELTDTVQLGGTKLKPGNYKIEIQGSMAVIKDSKSVVAQIPSTVETGKQTYSSTILEIKDSKLQSISIRGTNVKIVLKP